MDRVISGAIIIRVKNCKPNPLARWVNQATLVDYAMSRPTETNVEDETDFKWGNKKGDSVKNKDVQFYESFTYKGVEYFLYDCVYFYQAGDFETSIGKLVRIFETRTYEKKPMTQANLPSSFKAIQHKRGQIFDGRRRRSPSVDDAQKSIIHGQNDPYNTRKPPKKFQGDPCWSPDGRPRGSPSIKNQ
ncbi:protein ANTI-SILENCING 1 isoform X1 [Senna tora]|uniref:Protein ANTI-SILENCING 1 isoform X1 n=1 Tax=Senna tora TaxID=362788 RepID=A0A834TQ52_9FABA|nr:protein ANTI-SILENCING 1 isoform X1 [Senna tora]